MYVDNAAMQLLKNPKQFDVIVTGNIFGDILSDEASMLAGSIGMLPSASLDANQKGLYEPIHGSAPDIAGQDKANPLATILSLAMMFRYTFARADVAERIEARGAPRAAAGPSHRRHRAAGREDHRHAGDGRRRRRGVAERVMAPRRPTITIRRAAVSDAEAIQATFCDAEGDGRARCSCRFRRVEKWRKWLADSPADDYVLVAEVGGRGRRQPGLHVASKSPRRRHAAGHRHVRARRLARPRRGHRAAGRGDRPGRQLARLHAASN